VAVTVVFTAMRLGRNVRRGLVSLCLLLALWVTGLILLQTPRTATLAEHIVPSGMLLAGGLVHAHADVTGASDRRGVWAAYLFGVAVTVLGAVAPRLLYGPGAHGPGPLFFPIAAIAGAGSVLLLGRLGKSALDVAGLHRRRLAALFFGCTLGSLGGGFVVALRVLGWADVSIAAPLLLPAILLVAYAVASGEHGRSRQVFIQGLAYAGLTAALSSIGLTVFFRLLPHLVPEGGQSTAWMVFVIFFAALPADPLRMLVVELVGRRLFDKPIGVRDLAEEVDRVEVRADQAERLAEIGKLASAVAHEIRNPLGVIAAQAKLLERQGAKPEAVAALRAQVDRAKRFLEDLLRYSRPRPIDASEVEVLPALRLAASQVRQAVGETAPPIEIESEGGEPVFVEADRGAFLDVATVLMTNAAIALDGNPEGRIRATTWRADGAVIVRVEDNGPGVPEAIEASLFQPFVTGRGRDAKHPGTGLGLAIAARWVDRHGGALRYERIAGSGARFSACWPDKGSRAR
jgi:signal transduction histidine kinase